MLNLREVKVISEDDWDQLVSETYGKVYCFQQQDGCRESGHVFEFHVDDKDFEDLYKDKTVPDEINGPERGVDFEIWLKRDPKEWNGDESKRISLKLFWQRNFYPDIDTVAKDLHKRGLLPSGDYLIEID